MLGAFGSVVNEASFHSLSSRFLNAFTVGAETKFTGRAFHKFTTRCVKKCLRTSSIDRPFSSLQDTRYKSIYWQPRRMDCHIHDNTQTIQA